MRTVKKLTVQRQKRFRASVRDVPYRCVEARRSSTFKLDARRRLISTRQYVEPVDVKKIRRYSTRKASKDATDRIYITLENVARTNCFLPAKSAVTSETEMKNNNSVPDYDTLQNDLHAKKQYLCRRIKFFRR
jgi:hypothetical protein